MNKKGLTGEAVAWMSAFLIIFFILMIFNVLTINLANVKKAVFNRPGVDLNKNLQEITLLAEKNLAGVLESRIDYQGITSIADGLVLANSEKDLELVKVIDKALNNNCKEYFLTFSYGYLYKQKDKDLIFIDNINIYGKEYLMLFNKAILKLDSKGKIIEINYLERDYCDEK